MDKNLLLIADIIRHEVGYSKSYKTLPNGERVTPLEKINIPKKFPDVIALGKHLVNLKEQGIAFYQFKREKLSVIWAIEYLRKQVKAENARKNKKTILKQENINSKTDTILVIGKTKERVSYG